jgi:hypothetical protein
MPQQETFLELQTPDGGVVTVVKTYDQQFAKEVFGQVDEEAKELLWKSLKIEETYDASGLPGPNESEDRDALLLDEMLDEGRDVWPDFSYFVVAKKLKEHTEHFYVSPDWPSAEEYVKIHFQLPPVPAP